MDALIPESINLKLLLVKCSKCGRSYVSPHPEVLELIQRIHLCEAVRKQPGRVAPLVVSLTA